MATSTYCGSTTGTRLQIPGVLTVKYLYPVLFFTDAIITTGPAASRSVAWKAAQLANGIPGGPVVGFGLPVRPFLRHDFFEVCAISDKLRSGGSADLTSEKATAALHKYAHVIPTAHITRVHIADVWSHKNVRFRLYYGHGRKAELLVLKSSSNVVRGMLQKALGDRFDAVLR